MYRRSRKYQEYVTKYAKARAAREEKGSMVFILNIRLNYLKCLAELHRLIKVTDYNTGTIVTHRT